MRRGRLRSRSIGQIYRCVLEDDGQRQAPCGAEKLLDGRTGKRLSDPVNGDPLSDVRLLGSPIFVMKGGAVARQETGK